MIKARSGHYSSCGPQSTCHRWWTTRSDVCPLGHNTTRLQPPHLNRPTLATPPPPSKPKPSYLTAQTLWNSFTTLSHIYFMGWTIWFLWCGWVMDVIVFVCFSHRSEPLFFTLYQIILYFTQSILFFIFKHASNYIFSGGGVFVFCFVFVFIFTPPPATEV